MSRQQLLNIAVSLACVILVSPQITFAEEGLSSYSPVPFSDLFYHLDSHLLGSFTYNDGLNHLITIPATYAIINSGIDWKWNTYANDKGISNPGFAAVEAGALAPIVVPLTLYIYGRSAESERLQITGLALGQAALLSVGISSAVKALTGRRPPDDQNVARGTRDYSGDFHFGLLRRGAYDGWPSSHTMNAFAMAATLSELYPENNSIHIASYAYASVIGLGVSTNIHWLSDAVGGALIGYAIGKTVGSGFRELMGAGPGASSLSISLNLQGLSIAYRF